MLLVLLLLSGPVAVDVVGAMALNSELVQFLQQPGAFEGLGAVLWLQLLLLLLLPLLLRLLVGELAVLNSALLDRTLLGHGR